MKKLKLIETFNTTSEIEFTDNTSLNEGVEKDSRVDGKYIIGMIEGQFFRPDGMSRNKRWYPRQLWEKALNCLDVKNRFGSSTMFGEIGHSDGPVEDMTLRNGCASHFVDKMWIDERGRGMGRAYILNTPTGNLLKTYLGAGCKLKVSTRGEGLFLDGETHEGCPIIDPDSYELQTADFVINPGFLETSANLKEEYTKVEESIVTHKQQIEETIAHVKKEGEKRMALDIEAYVSELKEELKSLKDENKSLNEKLQANEKELLQKQFGESAEVQKLNEELAPFKKLKLSAESLKEAFGKSQDLLKKERAEKKTITEELESYKAKCGTLEEIEEAVEISTKSLKIIEEYRKFGSPEEIQKLAEQASKMLDTMKSSRASKKLSESKSRKLLEAYKKFGTPEDIATLVDGATRLLEDAKEAKKLEKNVRKLMAEVKKSKDLEKVCERSIEALKAMKASKINESVEAPVKEEVAPETVLELSSKVGATVEETAKLIKEEGVEKATEILESKVETKVDEKVELKESTELVENVSKLDEDIKVEEKDAKQYLNCGMIKNYFNQISLGKKFTADLNQIADEKQNNAKDLLKKYAGKVEVAEAPEVKPVEEDADAMIKKLLKK